MEAKWQARKEAFIRQFPWLSCYVDWDEIDSITVEKIDWDFLESWFFAPTPLQKFGRNPVSMSRFDHRSVFLLSKDGAVLGRVGFIPRKPNYAWWKPSTYAQHFNETVGDAVARLDDKGKVVHFALVFDGRSVIIRKPPKAFSLEKWRSFLCENEKNSLQQKLTAIDAEGEKVVGLS